MIVKPDTYQALFGEQVTEESVSWWLTGGIPAANCIAAYQPKGAASLAASYTNLANAGTYDAAPGVAPGWGAATGWTFNGSTQYLMTGFVQAEGMTGIVRFSNHTNDTRALFGSRGDPRFYVIARLNGINLSCSYGDGNAISAPIATGGVVANAGGNLYRDGAYEAQYTTWVGSSYAQIAIGAFNRGASIDLYAAAEIQAIAFYNVTLSAPQVAAVSAAMAAL